MKLIRLTYLLGALFFVQTIAAQKVYVDVSTDKQRILIGEQMQLKLQVIFAKNQSPSFFGIDTIDHFEILNRSKIDTILTEQSLALSQILTLTSFDSGKWQIPEFVLGRVKTKPIIVEVVFSPFDPNQPYHDIKDILKVEENSKRSTWYWYVIGAILLLLLFILLFPKKKKEAKPMVVNKDAYKIALAELDRLEREGVAIKDRKAFYTILIDILRKYLVERKNIESHTKTTDDLAVQIKPLNLPSDVYQNLVQELRLGDAVKFAKFQPDVAEANRSLKIIRESIQQIEKI